MACPRLPLALCLAFAFAPLACTNDEGQATGTADPTDASSSGPGPGPETTDPDDSGGNCVAGQAGCSCLDGQCVGGTYCVEDVCQLGPIIDVEDQDRAVVGGVLVPLEAEVDAESFTWSQVSGPPVEILGGETLQIGVSVPADAPPGETVLLRISATRNGVTLDGDIRITILDAVFENALPGVTDPTQIGSTEGLAFGPTGMWVVSTEGFVSRFAPDGAFIERYDVPGAPVGADYFNENLVVANRDGTGRVEQVNTVSGNISTLFDTIGGSPVGEVNLPLVRELNDDFYEVYVSTRLGQTVLRWGSEAGSGNVFLQDAGVVNPNALAFGPEGNAIYVGAQGHVWRVPLTDEGVAGTPEDYLALPDDADITYEVDGLAFDEGNNLWIGCPNASTLFVSHYSVMAPAQISRTFTDVGGGVSRFVNLTFGGGDFEDDTLYYTNLGDGTVGRLRVGLRSR